MSERMLLNRIKKLKELEAQQKAIEKQMEELKEDIKADMLERDLEEQQAGDFIVRWTKVLTGRFDSKAFQKDVYKRQFEDYLRGGTAIDGNRSMQMPVFVGDL